MLHMHTALQLAISSSSHVNVELKYPVEIPAIGGRLQMVMERHSNTSTPVAIVAVMAEKAISWEVVALMRFISQPPVIMPPAAPGTTRAPTRKLAKDAPVLKAS
eukprot:scaffold1808_cov360-Prasinococcus_capsulatus_cf.AAC.15